MTTPLMIPDLRALAGSAALEGLAWRPLRPGVDLHTLYDAGPEGASAALLRYAPGASVPRHLHTGHEHVLVLSGAQQDENGRYQAGALVVNPPGSVHAVSSVEGCVVLVIWERPVAFAP